MTALSHNSIFKQICSLQHYDYTILYEFIMNCAIGTAWLVQCWPNVGSMLIIFLTLAKRGANVSLLDGDVAVLGLIFTSEVSG